MIKNFIKQKFATISATIAAAFTFFFGLFLLLSGIYDVTQGWYGWYFGIVSIVGMLISISCPYIVYSKIFDSLDKSTCVRNC
ncbi:MAG: hypothetical protein L0H53_10280 [Candidatus Nitrosocosmicus sp.]|nr:hypothetical protein [Candidatus Nitrosocosmicus sp.]MDN5868471.1 hypothetical protein [Candidatus Nitrosocosmicus sp.]